MNRLSTSYFRRDLSFLRGRSIGTGYRYKRMASIPTSAVLGQTAWIAMENKESLPDVTRLSEHVVRVLGQNPGNFTLQGTNTYLIGTSAPYILVDTGEGRPEYIPILASALESLQAEASNSASTAPLVSDIILSHWHQDHVGGLPGVLTLLHDLWTKGGDTSDQAYQPPKLHKYPIPKGPGGGHHHSSYYILPKLVDELPKYLYEPSPKDGGLFHELSDGQTFVSGTDNTLLRVLHTPGHTVDSVSLYIPADKALYTADTVLGHGTAVFEDLATYLTSLKKMLHLGTSEGEGDIDLAYVSLYPAHGQVVSNGRETIATYIKHRVERDNQILGILQLPVPVELLDGEVGSVPWSTWKIVRKIYAAYPEGLWMPASRGVMLHLKKLEGEGLVRRLAGEEYQTTWELVEGRKVANL